jgi:hypothetical protein
MHSPGDGKIHINKYGFIDMIELAAFCAFLEPRIDRRSFPSPAGIQGRP